MSTDPDVPQDSAAGAPGGAPRDAAAPGSGPAAGPGSAAGAGAGSGAQPSEAELRAAYEAELARITSTDLMLQAAVSLLNVGSYRLMPSAPGSEPAATPGAGRDLEQVRDAIDGVRALMEILERRVPSELRPLRDALSQLQMAYAREVGATGQAPGDDSGGAAEGGEGPGGGSGGPGPEPSGGQDKPGPGPAESSGRLWVPGR